MDPNPGPTLEMEVAAPDIAVIKSSPVKDNKADNEKNITKYMYINEIIEAINLLLIWFWSYFKTKIPLGYIIFLIWFVIKE